MSADRQRRRGGALGVVSLVVVAACAPAGADRAGEAAGGGAEVAAVGGLWQEGPRLPAPVANNAVVAVGGPDGPTVLTFLGLDSTKAWSGVTDAAWRWDMGAGSGWRAIDPVPGPPRLAPTAVVLGGRVFVFGGYTVAQDGTEATVPTVAVYSPRTDAWGTASDMPVPVDDAVAGVYASSFVYLVSGWRDRDNVRDVQIFDPSLDLWSVATPVAGEPVFGHSGTVAGSDIVYVGGARVVEGRPRFVIDSTAWRGRIDPTDHATVSWERIPPPPGPPMYRAAAGSVNGRVVLVGGTDNPYNYDGVGYDGVPSSPVSRAVAYDPERGWLELPPPPVATMDHRTLATAGGFVFLVGGMIDGQVVSDRVWYADVDRWLGAAR